MSYVPALKDFAKARFSELLFQHNEMEPGIGRYPRHRTSSYPFAACTFGAGDSTARVERMDQTRRVASGGREYSTRPGLSNPKDRAVVRKR